MSPGHFSHHASLFVKGWWFGWIPELTVLSSAVSQDAAFFVFRATWQVTSQTAVICALWTSAVDVLLVQLRTATSACVRKMKSRTFTLRSLPAHLPPQQRGVGLLLWQQLSSVIQTPVNNVAIQNAVCDSVCLFTLLWGKRQYVPTGGLLVMALHHIVRGHSASIAQILSNN